MNYLAVLFVVVTYLGQSTLGEVNNTLPTTADSNKLETAYRHSKEFYIMAHNHMIYSEPFKNFTLTDSINWIHDIEDFVPPKEFKDKFIYYQAGFDDDNRPVWVGEAGKYNLKWILEQGQQAMENVEKYGAQACIRALLSIEEQRQKGNDIKDLVILADWEGFDYAQIANKELIAFGLTLFKKYADMVIKAIHEVIAINVSYPAEQVIQIGRPYIGNLLAKTQIYGTNKAKWLVGLKRALPEETIPTWYGGREDFAPIKIFG